MSGIINHKLIIHSLHTSQAIIVHASQWLAGIQVHTCLFGACRYLAHGTATDYMYERLKVRITPDAFALAHQLLKLAMTSEMIGARLVQPASMSAIASLSCMCVYLTRLLNHMHTGTTAIHVGNLRGHGRPFP